MGAPVQDRKGAWGGGWVGGWVGGRVAGWGHDMRGCVDAWIHGFVDARMYGWWVDSSCIRATAKNLKETTVHSKDPQGCPSLARETYFHHNQLDLILDEAG